MTETTFPLLLCLTDADIQALDRFRASQPEELTRSQAARLLLREALGGGGGFGGGG